MKHTIEHMPSDCQPSHVLIDGNRIPKVWLPLPDVASMLHLTVVQFLSLPHRLQELKVPATAVVKGDATVYCISAASVLAKVTRDRIMHEMHTKYPKYDFAQHKGYGAYTRSSSIWVRQIVSLINAHLFSIVRFIVRQACRPTWRPSISMARAPFIVAPSRP